MARKKDELGAREKTIHFRVSEAFYEVIAHEARQCGLSMSEFCRRVLINRPIKKLPVIIHDEREIKQELRNINKLGNNLNQIARYLNEGGQMNETLAQEIKKQRENPAENRAVFYNTHPAIIEPEVFDKVQEIRKQRHRRTKTGKSHMFSGLVFCADCKARMRYCTTSYFEERQDHFVCANYRSNTGTCSAHFIRAVVMRIRMN